MWRNVKPLKFHLVPCYSGIRERIRAFFNDAMFFFQTFSVVGKKV